MNTLNRKQENLSEIKNCPWIIQHSHSLWMTLSTHRTPPIPDALKPSQSPCLLQPLSWAVHHLPAHSWATSSICDTCNMISSSLSSPPSLLPHTNPNSRIRTTSHPTAQPKSGSHSRFLILSTIFLKTKIQIPWHGFDGPSQYSPVFPSEGSVGNWSTTIFFSVQNVPLIPRPTY